MHKGSCLCGAVTFAVAGDLPPATACHCTMCRKSTGHYEAGVDVDKSAVTITGGDKVPWFQSSEKVRRGSARSAARRCSSIRSTSTGSA